MVTLFNEVVRARCPAILAELPPDAIDLDRPNPRSHLGYGEGIHFCPGAPLARTDTRVALEVLLERLPGLRLQPGVELRHAPHFFLRGFAAVPVEWDEA